MIEHFKLQEINSKVDCIFKTLECIKAEKVNKIYTTEQLCKYLGVGKSVIDTYKKNGELPYSKIGRTFLFTQKDVDYLLEINKVKYVS